VLVNAYSPITGITCLLCLIFLFFESAFGICLACKFYSLLFKQKAQYCPGEVCERKQRVDIQRTTGAQLLIVAAFITFLIILINSTNDFYSKKPYDLFGINATAKTR
jgi:hypothetical protein